MKMFTIPFSQRPGAPRWLFFIYISNFISKNYTATLYRVCITLTPSSLLRKRWLIQSCGMKNEQQLECLNRQAMLRLLFVIRCEGEIVPIKSEIHFFFLLLLFFCLPTQCREDSVPKRSCSRSQAEVK